MVEMAQLLIPVWFYGIDTLTYAFAAVISLVVSFYSLKLYSATSKKSHQYLYQGFSFLFVGFLVLTMVNGFSYVNLSGCPNCPLRFLDEFFDTTDLGYVVYFGFSMISYILFLAMYELEEKKF